jgi:hypothetical protein
MLYLFVFIVHFVILLENDILYGLVLGDVADQGGPGELPTCTVP